MCVEEQNAQKLFYAQLKKLFKLLLRFSPVLLKLKSGKFSLTTQGNFYAQAAYQTSKHW
jgi:hypothetical protein